MVARRAGVAVLASFLLSSCAASSQARTDEIWVFAASSLTDAFGELAAEFENRHPGQAVQLNFGSSSDLATQIEQGAPAHVFAAADTASAERVVDAGLVEEPPRVFARNRLALITPASDPGEVDGLADLEREQLVVSLCSEECPAGIYARELFEKAGLKVRPDSLEPEVRGVLTRVATGEADAGIVYASDAAAAAGDVRRVPIPNGLNVLASYPVVMLEGAPAGARRFVALLLSRTGRRILAEAGFLPR